MIYPISLVNAERAVGLLMTPVHATHDQRVANAAVVAVVAVAALPVMLIPHVHDAQVPVFVGASLAI